MNTTIKIIRVTEDNECTLGVITYENQPLAVTLELPDKQNQRNVSRIPEGTYNVHKIPSTNQLSGGLGKVLVFDDVPDRDGILVHVGNTASDTLGCIIVGKYYGMLYNQKAVLESRDAFKKLMSIIPDKLTCEIINVNKPIVEPIKEPEKVEAKPIIDKSLDKKAEALNDIFNRGRKTGK